MSNVRELLARLNPQTVKMDIGRGGVAELTNQDIAAALAFVTPGLGREVLIACWWPDGGYLSRTKLRAAVLGLVHPELRRQAARLTEARTDLGIAEAIMGWGGAVTAEQRSERDRARARLEQVAAQAWPRNTLQSLPSLTGAVLKEIATAHRCADCEGRGEIIKAELLIKCPNCKGTGLDPNPDLRRAKALETDSRNFVRHWKPVYEWLLGRFREAEQEAVRQLSDALGHDQAGAAA